MSSVTVKLMTAEEFWEWQHRPENYDREFELERGEVVEVSRPGERHGAVCNNAGRILGNFTFQRRKGYVCSNDTGIVLERDPDTVRGPDLLLYDAVRRFDELEPKFTEKPPDLAVEVLSPNDRMVKVLRRIEEFLRQGIKLVWLLDPEEHKVTVFRADKAQYVLSETDELTGDDVLPDFHCPSADFFRMPG